MSISSPVTLRTTSGPVTKIRPWSDMITMSVSAGPVRRTAGRRAEDHGDLRHHARGAGHGGEDAAHAVQRLDALGEPGAARVPQASNTS